jgi:hypothetical protein
MTSRPVDCVTEEDTLQQRQNPNSAKTYELTTFLPYLIPLIGLGLHVIFGSN